MGRLLDDVLQMRLAALSFIGKYVVINDRSACVPTSIKWVCHLSLLVHSFVPAGADLHGPLSSGSGLTPIRMGGRANTFHSTYVEGQLSIS